VKNMREVVALPCHSYCQCYRSQISTLVNCYHLPAEWRGNSYGGICLYVCMTQNVSFCSTGTPTGDAGQVHI